MKRSVIACMFLAVTVLGTGCGAQKTNDRGEYPQRDASVEDASVEDEEEESSAPEQTSPRIEDKGKLNHGYSISDRLAPDPSEILRSEEVLYDEEEALAFLADNIVYPKREPYTFELSDSSMNDPGAYLWYDFTVCYKGIPIERSEFTVITFNDGTIIEGDESVFRAIPEDLSAIKTPEEILADYAVQYSDDRDFKYREAHYVYRRKYVDCPYAYVYRYDCGKVLENTTLTLNAKTGELLGSMPDAID